MTPTSSRPDDQGPVSEADLHAYADGLLAPARQALVEAFLAEQPAARARVDEWRALNQALRGMLDPVRDEPLPLRLPLSPPERALPWRALAAGIVVAVFSASTAWWLRGEVDAGARAQEASARARSAQVAAPLDVPSGTAPFIQRAVAAHVVYTPDLRRPVEVGGDQRQALVTWLTKRMGAPVRAPDLRSVGYDLMGGRLLPGDAMPVAQFMFEDAAGQRLTLYVTREAAGKRTAFQFSRSGDVDVFHWVDQDFGYALSAYAGKEELLRVAQAVYAQLEAPDTQGTPK